MSLSLNQQIFIFLALAVYGICASVLFDLFRCVYRIYKPSAVTVGIGDILFWFILSVATFFALFTINNGQIRIFEFLAMICGSIIYFLTLSPIVIFIFSAIIKIFKKIFSFFFKICLTIALFLYKMVLRILTCITIPFRWVFKAVKTLFKRLVFKFHHSVGMILKNNIQRRKIVKSKRTKKFVGHVKKRKKEAPKR